MKRIGLFSRGEGFRGRRWREIEDEAFGNAQSKWPLLRQRSPRRNHGRGVRLGSLEPSGATRHRVQLCGIYS